MKTAFATLVALIAVFALSACGGGNNATNSGSNGGGDDGAKEMTPADHRQALVDKMNAATEALDWDAMKALFQGEDVALAEKRIAPEFKELKEKKGTIKIKETKIEETEGKFFVTVVQTIEVEGVKDDDDHKLRLLEVDGKWYLSFQK
jgi:hypothetical protein